MIDGTESIRPFPKPVVPEPGPQPPDRVPVPRDEDSADDPVSVLRPGEGCEVLVPEKRAHGFWKPRSLLRRLPDLHWWLITLRSSFGRQTGDPAQGRSRGAAAAGGCLSGRPLRRCPAITEAGWCPPTGGSPSDETPPDRRGVAGPVRSLRRLLRRFGLLSGLRRFPRRDAPAPASAILLLRHAVRILPGACRKLPLQAPRVVLPP